MKSPCCKLCVSGVCNALPPLWLWGVHLTASPQTLFSLFFCHCVRQVIRHRERERKIK
jgi:hypothetical protein